MRKLLPAEPSVPTPPTTTAPLNSPAVIVSVAALEKAVACFCHRY